MTNKHPTEAQAVPSEVTEQAAQTLEDIASDVQAAQAAQAEPTAPADPAAVPEEGPAASSSVVLQLQTELVEAQNQVLRAHAELDNFRKRTQRQLDEERKLVNLEMIRQLLPVIDNLQRAVQAAERAAGGDGLLEGVRLVVGQLLNLLERHHCQPIEAQGKIFDPHLHEAIAHLPSLEHPAGAVIDVAQLGYVLHDRVVRPTQVLVSSGPPPTPDTGPEAAADPAGS